MKIFTRSILTVGLLLAFVPFCCADWTDSGTVNGVRVYRDNATGLEWTQTLGRTTSYNGARQKVASMGFRLPTHSEYRSLEQNRGINKLRIPTGWAGDFCWEASGQVVGGYGGNFKSLFPANYKSAGNNIIIGVRTSSTVSTPVSTTPATGTTVQQVRCHSCGKVYPANTRHNCRDGAGSTVGAVSPVTNPTNNNGTTNSNENNNGLPVVPNYDD